MPKGSGQHVDWETLQMKAKATTTLPAAQNSSQGKGKSSSSLPVYDGVGPRYGGGLKGQLNIFIIHLQD